MNKETDVKASLLGKVAKFIKNPTMDWAEIDRPGQPAEPIKSFDASSPSHLALKEMIQGKRRNDLVRKREFEVLRKIRREGNEQSEAFNTIELTSSYTSSQFNDDNAEKKGGEQKRERTLRQIDEIEAQLSHSWFRVKPNEIPTMPMKLDAARPQPKPVPPTVRPGPPPVPASAVIRDSVPPSIPELDLVPTTLPLGIDFPDHRPLPNHLSDGHADTPPLPELKVNLAPSREQAEPPVLTQAYQPRTAAGGTISAPKDQPPLARKDARLSGLTHQNSPGQLDTSKLGLPAHTALGPPQLQPRSSFLPNKPTAPFKAEGSFRPVAPFQTAGRPPVPKPQPGRRASVYENVLQGNLEVVALEQDPEIEGAAISFANGDETAAESTLLKLINPDSRRREEVEVWLALFDLYRAADQYDAFNDLAPKFITLFGRSAPQWERMRDQEMSVTTDLAPQVPRTGFFTWTSPPQLNAEALETLTGAVAYAAAPWRLDWRAIKGIKPDVLPQFNALFTQWADTPTQLQFLGSEQLLAVLIEQSPIGNQSVNPAWWRVRMALLRLMGATDQFDQTALNYCITYEISPPAWIPPKSSYVPLDADVQPESEPVNDRSAAQQTFALTTTTGELPAATEAFKAALSGEILGSVRPMLAALPNDLERIKTIDFNCRALRRVDFGAAGGLLNWSIEQQGQGRTVTFRDMHRLLAAFFSVIGINAAARVILRKD